jgi:transposase, IS30 family
MLLRSLTWTKALRCASGSRSASTDSDVYSPGSHAIWQRGSNENTNGQLRQDFPEAPTSASTPSWTLDHFAAELNDRTGTCHGVLQPHERVAKLLLQ